MANTVTIVEVGLRDGLQNESQNVSAEDRIELAKKLVAAGSSRLELGAFVRADRVPQMAGSKEVIQAILKLQKEKKLPSKTQFTALVPNERGFEDALQTGIKEIAVFAGCSESFSQRNINCSIEESFLRFEPVLRLAKKNKIKVRGYLSVCFGCPFEGKVSEEKVVELAHRLYKMGCYEISIGDTIGIAHPGQVQSLFKKLKRKIPTKKLAGHFHDTRGTALVNIFTAFQMGIRVFDSSLGGLGGCPYAPAATGNVATEDVVYMFHGLKVKTGLSLEKLLETNTWMAKVMNKTLPSRIGKFGLLKPLGPVSK
jgi:hydroxymethylglutaryl-CoA lyase